MLICAAGDIHGKIDRMYLEIERFSVVIGRSFDLVLQVGDFGIWPDPLKVDKPTREHGGAGDFPRWWREKKAAPIPTCFIKGNHEDFAFLRTLRTSGTILPGLRYLENGSMACSQFTSQELLKKWRNSGAKADAPLIGAVGGCYAESDSDEIREADQPASPSHYTKREVAGLLKLAGRVDVLLLHDAPDGITLPPRGNRPGYITRGPGLRRLVESLRPNVCFFGHHHVSVRTEITGVPVIGLSLIGRPGFLVAWDTEKGFVAEWPG